MEIEHKHTYFLTNSFCILKVANIVVEQNFGVISGKFHVQGIYTIGHYAHKWVTELYNYSILALLTPGIFNEIGHHKPFQNLLFYVQ
jgi:hypothetical protein